MSNEIEGAMSDAAEQIVDSINEFLDEVVYEAEVFVRSRVQKFMGKNREFSFDGGEDASECIVQQYIYSLAARLALEHGLPNNEVSARDAAHVIAQFAQEVMLQIEMRDEKGQIHSMQQGMNEDDSEAKH